MNPGAEAAGKADESAPPLLISTPFGIGVRDLAWLEHRLVLIAAITAPSLMAQHDQNFHWAIFVDSDLPPAIYGALEEILAPFEGRAFIYSEHRQRSAGYGVANVLALARERCAGGADGYLFTARIDDDDAWSRDVVGSARDRAASWIRNRGEAPGLGFTFENGLEWIMYEMVDLDLLQKHGRMVKRPARARPYTFPFLGTSVFVLSRPASGMTAVSAGHARMGEFLEGKGYDVDVVSTARPMWLYCRHKQAGSAIQKARGDGMEVTLTELAGEFGLDEARTARYLESTELHGYGVAKRVKRRLARLKRELREVKRQLDGQAANDAHCGELRRQEAQLMREIAHTSENVVGDLETEPNAGK